MAKGILRIDTNKLNKDSINKICDILKVRYNELVSSSRYKEFKRLQDKYMEEYDDGLLDLLYEDYLDIIEERSELVKALKVFGIRHNDY
jgi:hypothetical protein